MLMEIRSVCHMGSHRTRQDLFAGPYLLGPLSLFHTWRRRSCSHLPRCEAMASLTATAPHGPSDIRRRRRHPARHAAQLLFMGHRGLCFPVLDQEAAFRLVEPSQLSHIVWSGSGLGAVHALHLLRLFHAGH